LNVIASEKIVYL